MPRLKTDWELTQTDDGYVVARKETPLLLWVLDRWFRIPDSIFDFIEWRYPLTAPVTRVPCLLYSRWYPELVIRQTWTDYRVAKESESDLAADIPGSED